MNHWSKILADAFIRITGFTYTNMARLFMRLFVGVMMMQFGIKHLMNYETLQYTFPAVMGMGSSTCLILMIVIELVCSLFIMAGFLTRLAVIPPIIAMLAAEYHIIHDLLGDISVYGIDSTQPGYLPVMFIGIYLFILLAGPGKISLDYFITLFLLQRNGKHEEEELEEV